MDTRKYNGYDAKCDGCGLQDHDHHTDVSTTIFIGYDNGGIVQLIDTETMNQGVRAEGSVGDFTWTCFGDVFGNILTMSVFATIKLWCVPLVGVRMVKEWLMMYSGTREYDYDKLVSAISGRTWVPAIYYPVMEVVKVFWGKKSNGRPKKSRGGSRGDSAHTARMVCTPYPNIARTGLTAFRANTYQTIPPKWRILLEQAVQYDVIMDALEQIKQWRVGYRVEIGPFIMEVIGPLGLSVCYQTVGAIPEYVDVDAGTIDALMRTLREFNEMEQTGDDSAGTLVRCVR